MSPTSQTLSIQVMPLKWTKNTCRDIIGDKNVQEMYRKAASVSQEDVPRCIYLHIQICGQQRAINSFQ